MRRTAGATGRPIRLAMAFARVAGLWAATVRRLATRETPTESGFIFKGVLTGVGSLR